ncbi:MAG: CopG family transcriptional regulator [Deltaproteobacteria bacterium]|nr:CopG family transcriptional regulator [Deltaproteobacteria bacterium]
MRRTKPITTSVRPEFLAKIDKLAKEEGRTRSELLREALLQYLHQKEYPRTDSDDSSIFVNYMPKNVPEDQKWFWTKEWQEKEKEADRDIAEGLIYGPFETVDDLIKSLDGFNE